VLSVQEIGTVSPYFCSVKTKRGGTTMNKNLNFIVNVGDRICASLECNGRRLASVNGVNFTSLESVKSTLLDMAGRYAGMAVLTVRNCTQGWRDVTALATMRRAMTAPQQASDSQPRIGNQYLIPWAS
jgi:hypothetical protein